jgi:diguanylate cyclase (GGDEF)-like protein
MYMRSLGQRTVHAPRGKRSVTSDFVPENDPKAAGVEPAEHKMQLATITLPRPEEPVREPEVWRPDNRRGARTVQAMRGLGLLMMAALIGWTVGGSRLVSEPLQQSIEVLAIVFATGAAFVIAAHSRRVNVALERAYAEHLEGLNRQLQHLAYHDSLTDLYNHRYFQQQLLYELERAQRYGHPLSLLMLDLNGFKNVNDTYGHIMGDDLLAYIARLIGENLRGVDITARYGGDEFAVVLPETDRQQAEVAAEKLRTLIATTQQWQSALLNSLNVSVAVGVATYPMNGDTVDKLLLCADRGLYAAKSKKSRRQSRPRLRRTPVPSPLGGGTHGPGWRPAA